MERDEPIESGCETLGVTGLDDRHGGPEGFLQLIGDAEAGSRFVAS